MNGLNSPDLMTEQLASAQQSSSAMPHLLPIAEAPEANMFPQSEVPIENSLTWLMQQQINFLLQHALQQQQQQQQQPQQLAHSMNIPQMPELSQLPFGSIHMPQQAPSATPRRAYLKRRRETPTPKRQTAATTPGPACSEPCEVFPEVNFNDHSAYKRLLSSVWDYKGDPPWSHYTVQQV
jgi:hypothetical protein